VVRYIASWHRLGVDIDGVGMKSIKMENITAETVPLILAKHRQESESNLSADDSTSFAAGVVDANADISRGLLNDRVDQAEGSVVLLKFARNPRKF